MLLDPRCMHHLPGMLTSVCQQPFSCCFPLLLLLLLRRQVTLEVVLRFSAVKQVPQHEPAACIGERAM